jgi:hypothetical protein
MVQAMTFLISVKLGCAGLYLIRTVNEATSGQLSESKGAIRLDWKISIFL